jgi:hypothetical protein
MTVAAAAEGEAGGETGGGRTEAEGWVHFHTNE